MLPHEEEFVVPGMTERDRRAADLQRLEWLADAALGPTRTLGTTRGDKRKRKHVSLRMTFRCRGFALTPWFGQRVCGNQQHAT
jgi:hypothetical protein